MRAIPAIEFGDETGTRLGTSPGISLLVFAFAACHNGSTYFRGRKR
jgi:hypothetical protein